MSRTNIGKSTGKGLAKTLLWSGSLQVDHENSHRTIVFDKDLSGRIFEIEFSANIMGATNMFPTVFAKIRIDNGSFSTTTSGYVDEAIYTKCESTTTEYISLRCGRLLSTDTRATDLKTMMFRVDTNNAEGGYFIIKNIYEIIE